MELIHVLAGALVGLIIGLTGVGGGSLMTPILVLGFGITPVIAVGTDLLYAALTKCCGVYFHHKNQTVDWKIVLLLASGSIPCSLITLSVLDHLKKSGVNYDEIIMLTLGAMLILTAIIILLKNQLLVFIHATHPNTPVVKLIRHFRPQIAIICGCLLGCVVTLSSVGAGAIGSAILFLLYPRKPSITIIGTDIAHAVPLTAIAGMGHLHFGSVDFNLLFGLLVGGIPTIYLGSMIGKKLPDNLLRFLIAVILMMMGMQLIFSQLPVMRIIDTFFHQIMQSLFVQALNLLQ